MRQGILFALLLLVSAWAAAQQVYRWVDAEGVVHYSDQPPPDGSVEAETVAIDIPPGIGNPSQQILRSNNGGNSGISSRQANNALLAQQQGLDQPEVRVEYRDLIIIQPETEQVLWNLATRLPVRVQVTPGLEGSHQVQMLLDGQPVGTPFTGSSSIVSPVYRGEHSLTPTIIDRNGQTLFTGESIRIYVQQASRAN